MKKVLMMVLALALALGNLSVVKAATYVKEEYKGKYGTYSAKVKANLVNQKSMKVKKSDYKKYFKYLDIGNGLKIKLDGKVDFDKVYAMQTAEAKKQNDEYIRKLKAFKKNRKTMKQAVKKAKAKAKAKYKEKWELKSEKMKLPATTDGHTKTYMDYKTVTAKGSPQYALLNGKDAKTKDGFRMVDGYYCIALGSFYGSEIGTKYYVDLSNGVRLKCILGDQKANRHTDENHQFAVKNKDVVEFIVDNIKLPGGDVSAVEGFEGKVVQIRKITDERAYEKDLMSRR